jgi:hypothetical protein
MTSNQPPAAESSEQTALRLAQHAHTIARKVLADVRHTIKTITEDIARRRSA